MRLSRSTTTLASLLGLMGCASAPRPASTTQPKLTPAQVQALQVSADTRCQHLTPRAERDAGHADSVRAQQAAPKDRTIGLILARCSLMRADLEKDPNRLLVIAEQGAEAARSVSRGPDDAEAAYLSALNLGLYVRAKGLTAVGRLSEMVALLKTAGAQPQLDQGGPLRALGLLYVKAPGWPIGPGDLDAGLDLLKQAAEKFPEHPLNHLFYAYALIAAGEKASARGELDRARALCAAERFGDWATRWKTEADEATASMR
jgi:tetratricopeptide (TPR) repeat protein